ncbi:MAG: PilZ domain-containing protein [bacterium]
MIDFRERRRYPRYVARVPLKLKEIGSGPHSERRTLTGNLSEGGVKFSVDRFISPQSRVFLELTIPSAPKLLRIMSRVAWIKKLPDTDSYEGGNEFLDMTKKDKSEIFDYITNNLENQY